VFTTLIYDIITPKIDTESASKLPYMFIVMEFVDTDLSKIMRQAEQIEFDEEHLKCLLYNILCSLNFIHTANLIHRDIKPANILVDEDCLVKICDFGLSRTRIEQPYDDMEDYVNAKFNESPGHGNNFINFSESVLPPINTPMSRNIDFDQIVKGKKDSMDVDNLFKN